MPQMGDLAIGVAMLARSLVACDAAFAPAETPAGGGVDPLRQLAFPMPPRAKRGFSNDPARSRASIVPVSSALYETYPLAA